MAPAAPAHPGDLSREAYIFLGAGAAVLMQLAHPAVGLGVAEHSATLTRPLDRLRTTMTYIYALTLGTEEERRAVARGVNRAHGPVRSERYDAFDPQLQLWVAATLYRGGATLAEIFHGPLPREQADAMYSHAAIYGTTLQMPLALWPRDRGAFDAYWDRTVAHLQVEPKVRRFVEALLDGGAVPWWLRGLMPLQRFFTRGLLPPGLRDAFGLPWTPRDARRWERFLRHGPRLYWLLPRWLRHLPAALVLRDMRRRIAAGQSPI